MIKCKQCGHAVFEIQFPTTKAKEKVISNTCYGYMIINNTCIWDSVTLLYLWTSRRPQSVPNL